MAITVQTDPIAPNSSGWFITTPEAFVFDDGTTPGAPAERAFWSIGTQAVPGLYYPLTEEILDGELPISLNYAWDTDWNNRTDVYLFVYQADYNEGASTWSPDWATKIDVKLSYTTQAPVFSGFEVRDSNGALYQTYIGKHGTCEIKNFRAFSANVPADEYMFGTTQIDFYADSVRWATLVFWKQGSTWTANDYRYRNALYYWKRSSEPIQGFPPEGLSANRRSVFTVGSWGVAKHYSVSASYTTSDDNHSYFNAAVRFNTVDVPLGTSTLYAVITNDAGIQVRTSAMSLTSVYTDPIIDRIALTKNQDSEVNIIGNVSHVVPCSKVEWTEDRRVPMLEVGLKQANCYTADNVQPLLEENLAYSAGPHTPHNYSVFIGSSGKLEYSNSHVNINVGTFECFINAANWGDSASDKGRGHYIFEVAGKASGELRSNKDRILLKLVPGATYWELKGYLYDSFGQSWVSSYTTPWLVASHGSVMSWAHVRMQWRVNSSDNSYLRVQWNSSYGNEVSGANITFLNPPTYNYHSITAGEYYNSDVMFSNLAIGNSVFNSPSSSFNGYFSEIRVFDTIEDNNLFVSDKTHGWVTDNVDFDPFSGMFRIQFPDLQVNEVKIVKVRAVDIVGNVLNSSFFNTTASRPIIVRGPYAGVPNTYDEVVYRFRLIDSQGEFEDLRFTINPTNYNHGSEDFRYVENIALSGKRKIHVAPRPAMTREFDWVRIKRDFFVELEKRAYSGNSFYLVDHNDEILYGKFVLTSIEEITATVPSQYRVQARFIGQGGADDFFIA